MLIANLAHGEAAARGSGSTAVWKLLECDFVALVDCLPCKVRDRKVQRQTEGWVFLAIERRFEIGRAHV